VGFIFCALAISFPKQPKTPAVAFDLCTGKKIPTSPANACIYVSHFSLTALDVTTKKSRIPFKDPKVKQTLHKGIQGYLKCSVVVLGPDVSSAVVTDNFQPVPQRTSARRQ
jgi:hypothetical protein